LLIGKGKESFIGVAASFCQAVTGACDIIHLNGHCPNRIRLLRKTDEVQPRHIAPVISQPQLLAML
jgi:hypothetical protein